MKKILIALAAIFLLSIVIVFGFLFLINKKPETVKINNTDTTTNNYLTYKFTNYPVTISYDSSLNLSQSSDIVNITSSNGKLTINPNQKGVGLEDPFPEITELTIKNSDGTDFKINGVVVKKSKLVNKTTGETTFMVNILYPDNRSYGLLYSYQFNNGIVDENLSKLFDGIVISTKFNL